MSELVNEVRQKLLAFQDLDYKKFHSKLIPSVDPGTIIGIKVPVLRKFAKNLQKEYSQEQIMAFMKDLPHKYYEENNLHGFLIERIEDFDNCIYALEDFLPYLDNWATCDYLVPKCFKSNDSAQRARLLEMCYRWINSKHSFTIRFGIEQLMKFFLEDQFSAEYLSVVAEIKSQEYYVNMMRAWFFTTALSKHYEATLPYLKNNKLDEWTHNKIIQKANESRKISGLEKDELKKYKIKRRI